MRRAFGYALLLALLSPCALAQQRQLTPAEKLAILQAPKQLPSDEAPASPIPALPMVKEGSPGNVETWTCAVSESGWLVNLASELASSIDAPRGVLLVVVFHARNRAAEPKRPPQVTLVDERGHTYNASSISLPGRLSPYEEINPGLVASGMLAFDVPRERRELRFWLIVDPDPGPHVGFLAQIEKEAKPDPRVAFRLKPKTY